MTPTRYLRSFNARPAGGRMPWWKLRALKRQEARRRKRGAALPQYELALASPSGVLSGLKRG